jgi:hypothetical protein
MDQALKDKIIDILDQHRIVRVATNRPDGWPQATAVGYCDDGLILYLEEWLAERWSGLVFGTVSASFWWMHAMVVVWLLFTVMVFAAEPLFMHRWLDAHAQQRSEGTFRLVEGFH